MADVNVQQFVAFDGTSFKSKRAKRKYEREKLLRLWREAGNRCPWLYSFTCFQKCIGRLNQMEKCFDLKFNIPHLEEKEKVIFS